MASSTFWKRQNFHKKAWIVKKFQIHFVPPRAFPQKYKKAPCTFRAFWNSICEI
jgi:hypothetical protein